MALKRIELKLYIYDGLLGSKPTTGPQYEISKSAIDTQTNITLEIGELVRDYLDISFNDDYTPYSKWVEAVVTFYDQANEPYTFSNPTTYPFLALDGYGYFEEGTNPELDRHALMTSNNIYLPENTAGKFPIFKEGVGKVIIDSTTTQIIDNGNSNQKIQYVTIPANASIIKVYDTDDSTLRKTITVTNICEPKYTVYKITFINKYGAFEDFYAFKKSTESLEVTNEEYKRNTVVASSSTYSTYESQKARYNVNGNTTLSLNTGYVVEDMNTTIEELFLTEQVWIRYEGKTLPIMPKSKSLEYKTSLNDKLINYTIDFEFAFDKINNVR